MFSEAEEFGTNVGAAVDAARAMEEDDELEPAASIV
jgi:hypothetical protein